MVTRLGEYDFVAVLVGTLHMHFTTSDSLQQDKQAMRRTSMQRRATRNSTDAILLSAYYIVGAR